MMVRKIYRDIFYHLCVWKVQKRPLPEKQNKTELLIKTVLYRTLSTCESK